MTDTSQIPAPSLEKSPIDQRNKLFSILGAIVVICAITYGGYYYFVTRHYVCTENAYVAAEIAQISAQTGGIIKEIHFNDTDIVKKGDTLVTFDEVDAQLALAETDATLAKATAELERAKLDFQRRTTLAKSGSVSGEELSNAENAFKIAQSAYNLNVVAKEKATIDLSRTIVKAPIDGIIAKRQVQFGQRVAIGSVLMSIVPTQSLHVDANFKEVQLDQVKIGQPVKMISDFYGSDVVFTGKVAGIAAGTGAAFALIPAQNATGNWIKVVQRLPVRISLDAAQLAQHPLKVGLSMMVKIDIHPTP